MKWKFTPKGILVFTCVFYFIFSLSMMHPVNVSVHKHTTSTYGKLDRHILRPWRMAVYNAQKPFSEVKDHALYHERNPGLFKFIAELTARAGAQSPIPLEIALVFLVILGIIAQYTWLKEYFKKDIFPVVSCFFILGSHWLTYFGLTIHQHPYNFSFFNFCMLGIIRFTETKKIKYFVMTWFAYFFICQSYYMFWVSTFVMMVGIQYFAGTKIISLKNFTLGLAPILTLVLVVAQLTIAHGSFDKGLHAIKGAAKARVLDDIEDGSGFVKKMNKKDWIRYPLTISARVERYFYIPGFLFIFIGFILLRLRRINNSHLNYKLFYFIIPAGLSWYFFMFQHTAVHQVAGRYSYFLWMLVFAYLIFELNTYINNKYPNQKRQKWIKYTWPLIIIYGGYGFGFLNLTTLFANTKRYIDYKQTESKAIDGDIISRLEIKSNKFINGYKFYNDEWISNLNNMNIELSSGVSLIYQNHRGSTGFYIIKNNKQSFHGKKLYLNGKFIDLMSPNEDLSNWGHNSYVTLKLKNIGEVTFGEIK